MENEKDILRDNAGLKEMPFSAPEGYFESFARNMKPWKKEKAVTKGSHFLTEKVLPYVSLAAMFVLLVLGGTALLQHFSPDTGLEDETLFYSELMREDSPASYYSYLDSGADTLTEEDIIDYLIYSGISVEAIENISSTQY